MFRTGFGTLYIETYHQVNALVVKRIWPLTSNQKPKGVESSSLSEGLTIQGVS